MRTLPLICSNNQEIYFKSDLNPTIFSNTRIIALENNFRSDYECISQCARKIIITPTLYKNLLKMCMTIISSDYFSVQLNSGRFTRHDDVAKTSQQKIIKSGLRFERKKRYTTSDTGRRMQQQQQS